MKKRVRFLALLIFASPLKAAVDWYDSGGAGGGSSVGASIPGSAGSAFLATDTNGKIVSTVPMYWQPSSSTQTVVLGSATRNVSVFDIVASSNTGGILGIDLAGGFGNRVIDFWAEPAQVSLEGQIIGMSTTSLNGTPVNVGDFVLNAGQTLPNQSNDIRLFAGNVDAVDVSTGGAYFGQPAIFFGGITGVANNGTAVAGKVGEDIVVSSTSLASIAGTGSFGNVASISVGAGSYVARGCVTFTANSATITDLEVAISTFSANTTTDHVEGDNWVEDAAIPTSTAKQTVCVPFFPEHLAAATTVYLKAKGAFSVATPQALGTLRLLRTR